jgi:hypothetical protein
MILSQDLLDMHNWEKNRFLPPVPTLIRKATIARHALPGGVWFEAGGIASDLNGFAAETFPVAMTINQAEAGASRIEGNRIATAGPDAAVVLDALLKSIAGKVNFYLSRFTVAGAQGAAADAAVIAAAERILAVNPRLTAFKLFVDHLQAPEPASAAQGQAALTAELVRLTQPRQLDWCVEHGIFIVSSSAGRRTIPIAAA